MIQQTRLIKYIQFTQLARINIISLFCSSVFAVITAFMGWGVWALVIQSLGMAIVKSVLLWIYGRWRPKWIFRVASMKEFFGYSSSLIGTGVLNTIFNNIYPWLIGKGYSTQAVGYYNQANKFQDMPSALIANIFRSVAFPVLSSINDDRERMIRVFGKYIRTVSFIIFPIMFLLMLVSQPLISILLPEKWAPSIPLMQVLCISGAFSPFIILYYDLFNAVGRSDINLKMEIFKKIFFIIGILVCFKYSIMALMWLWVVYTLCSLIATMFLAHKYVNYTMGSFFFDIFPCLSISLIIAAMSSLYYLVFQDRWLLLVTISGTFGLLYIIAARLFRLEMWHECLQLFKKKVLTNGK
jgi:polysaccharide biosynthesis protein